MSKLTSVAAAAALAMAALASPSLARAQASSVTVYGIVDLFTEFGNAGKGTVTRVESGGIAQTRLGFTGREDLGGGLGAEFTLESGFAADTGSTGTNFWSRQAHVGLTDKSLGALRIGHQYTPLFLTTYAFDAFGLGTAGNFWNLSQYGNFWQDNAIVYETPDWSGLSARALYAPSEKGGSGQGKYSALSLSYNAGPLQLVGSFDKRGVVANGPQASYLALGGTYDFTVAKLFFGLQTVKHAEPAEAVNADARIYSLGVHVPVSATGKVAASYTWRDDRSAANQGASQIALGYYHALSKRTTLYTAASRISNKNGGALGIGYTPLAVTAGHSAQALQFGINHNF
jgi:predicted porin